MCRMRVLVYQESEFCIICIFRSWESTPSTINHLPHHLHSTKLKFSDIFFIYVVGLRSILEAGSHTYAEKHCWIEMP